MSKKEIKVSKRSTLADIFLATVPNILFSIVFPYLGNDYGLLIDGQISNKGIDCCIAYIIVVTIIIVIVNCNIHKHDETISKHEFENLKKKTRHQQLILLFIAMY